MGGSTHLGDVLLIGPEHILLAAVSYVADHPDGLQVAVGHHPEWKQNADETHSHHVGDVGSVVAPPGNGAGHTGRLQTHAETTK